MRPSRNNSPRSKEQQRLTSTPTITFDKGWRSIESLLLTPLLTTIAQGPTKKLKHQFQTSQCTSLYTHIYTMCTQKAPHNWSGKLYFEYRRHLQTHLQTQVLPALQQRIQRTATPTVANALALLQAMDVVWRHHCLYVTWTLKFFHYLNRFYVRRLAVDDLNTVTLKCFKEEVYDHVKDAVTAAYVVVVSAERDGGASKVVHDTMLERLTNMYLALGRGTSRIYDTELEQQLLHSAEEDTCRDSQRWLNQETTAGYLAKAEARLEEEQYRAKAYLLSATDAKLQHVVEVALLGSAQVQTVLLSHHVNLTGGGAGGGAGAETGTCGVCGVSGAGWWCRSGGTSKTTRCKEVLGINVEVVQLLRTC